MRAAVRLGVLNRSARTRTLSFTCPAPGSELFTQFPALAIEPNQRLQPLVILRLPRRAFAGQEHLATAVEVHDGSSLVARMPVTVESP